MIYSIIKKGILHYSNNETLRAIWGDGVPLPPIIFTTKHFQYVGGCKKFMREGFGVLTIIQTAEQPKVLKFYERYYGNFRNNLMNGKGVLVRLNEPNWIFCGDWNNGSFVGDGYIRLSDSVLKGYFYGGIHEDQISLTNGYLFENKVDPKFKKIDLSQERWSLFINSILESVFMFSFFFIFNFNLFLFLFLIIFIF